MNSGESGAALTGAAFDGPIDVIGDVHGEIDALEDLLHVLGYRGRGDHPAGRRLVFIGDLCDRGPDSPGVIRRVREMVEAGTAQCLLGNHEINVMRGSRKEANGWFYENDHDRKRGRFEASKPAAGDAEREEILAFLRSLPLVLERPDLRLVHACWSDERIAEAREAAGFSNAVELYRHYAALAEARAQASGLATEAGALLDHYRERLVDRSQPVPMLEALAERDLAYQMSNPVRVLTSGIERRAHEPFFMAGKWRMVERVEWWEDLRGGYARAVRPLLALADARGGPALRQVCARRVRAARRQRVARSAGQRVLHRLLGRRALRRTAQLPGRAVRQPARRRALAGARGDLRRRQRR